MVAPVSMRTLRWWCWCEEAACLVIGFKVDAEDVDCLLLFDKVDANDCEIEDGDETDELGIGVSISNRLLKLHQTDQANHNGQVRRRTNLSIKVGGGSVLESILTDN